ncbi:MAG: arsenate reductase (glutaredoxin) [Planctomycetes bacterium]|nr:arsenate reductase (glutaredoxin) [Planctomycetota bacterium]
MGHTFAMAAYRLYFNPACSKCRTARSLLDERDIDYELVPYLESPPAREELVELARLVGGDEERGSTLLLREKDVPEGSAITTSHQRLDLLVSEPRLLERPILRDANRAIVARPPELVIEFVQST